MAQYSTNFADQTVGVAPSDFTRRWVTTGGAWLVRAGGDYGGKYLEFDGATTVARRALSWDLIDADAGRDEADILFRFRGYAPTSSSDYPDGSGMARGSGAAGNETGFVGRPFTGIAADGVVAQRYLNGAADLTTESGITFTAEAWYWVQVRSWGDTVRVRRWLDDGTAEPGPWIVTHTDANVSAAGWVGLFAAGFQKHDIDYFAVGTGGDPAPFPFEARRGTQTLLRRTATGGGGSSLTVTGLSAGDVAQVVGALTGTIYASGSESGGSASVDMTGVPSGVGLVHVARSGEVVAQFTAGPDESIAAGDTYDLDADLVIPDAGINGQIDPTVRRYVGTRDRTYIGSISRAGVIKVSAYDHATGQVETAHIAQEPADDHSVPAILVDADGYIWAFYSGHAHPGQDAADVRYRRSSAPEDITEWGEERSVAWTQCTYPQVYQATSGRIVLFVRSGKATTDHQWQLRYTDDGGDTWASAVGWLPTSTYLYQNTRQDPTDRNVLWVLISWHPTLGAVKSVYVAKINLGTGDVTIPGDATSLGNIYSAGTLPADYTDFILAHSVGGTNSINAGDINRHGEVTLTEYDTAAPSTGTLRYVKVDPATGAVGTVRDVVALVAGTIGSGGSFTIFGGATLPEAGNVVYAGRYTGAVWTVERHVTGDGGATWTTTKLDADADGDVAPARWRPNAPSGETDDPIALFLRSRIYDSSGDWTSDTMIVSAEGPVPPAQPALSAEALSPTVARLTLTASDGDDYELYQDEVLIESWDAASLPATWDVEDLTPGESYSWVLRAINAEGHTDSDPAVLTMPGVGTPPVVRVDEITETTARAHQQEPDPEALHFIYRLYSSAGALLQTFDPVANTGEAVQPLTGLTADTLYRITGQALYDEGFSDEQDPGFSFRTLAVVIPPLLEIEFLSPAYGEPIRGEEAPITWTDVTAHGRTVAAFHLSGDLGDTWDAVAGATATGVEFDSTELDGGNPVYPDGFYIARLTLDDDTEIEHPGFLIDNDNAATFEDRFRPEDEVEFQRYWNPAVPRFMLSSPSCVFGTTGHIGANGPASFGPVSPIDLTFNRGALATASMAAFVTGGGFQWDRTWPGEVLDLGLAMVSHTGPNIGIRCGVRHTLLSSAMGPFPDPSDPHRFIGVGTGAFFLTVGPVLAADTGFSGTLLGGWGIGFSVPVPVGISWLQMRAGGSGPTDGCRVRPYHFALTVTQPDAGSFPNRYDIVARVNGPDAWSATGRYSAVIEETVDTPEPLECGHISFFTRKTAHSHYSNLSARVLRSFSTVVYDDCEDPPEPEPDIPEEFEEFELPPGRPCALHLECFEDDGITRFFEVTDDPDWLGYGDARPFLLDPAHQYSGGYAGQELDFIEGRASIGSAEWLIADVHQIAGDQDSGWLTERLSRDGHTAINGRRMRWRRYVGEFAGGWITISDGPGDATRMHREYAGYHGYIKDTRETERKTRAFMAGDTTTLFPRGVLDGYGWFPDAIEDPHWLVPPTEPAEGSVGSLIWRKTGITGNLFETVVGVSSVIRYTQYWSGDIHNPDSAEFPPFLILSDAAIEAGGSTRIEPTGAVVNGLAIYRHYFEGVVMMWRTADTDPWEINHPHFDICTATPINFWSLPETACSPAIHYWREGTVTGLGITAKGVAFLRRDGDNPPPSTTNTLVEVILRYSGPPTSGNPLHIELDPDEVEPTRLTAGRLAQLMYDGYYSPRDMDGNIVPTGIRYDPEALALMTTPVRLRITEPVNDIRDWLERYIYRPLGMAPALDHDGRISPVSQMPPEDDEYEESWLDSAVDINNAITEPAPSWTAGGRIVNEVEFVYWRDYLDPESPAADGLSEREITSIWRAADGSLDHHGTQAVKIEGLPFRALGNMAGGAIEVETGAVLASERGTVLISRYGEGAQNFTVAVMREHTWMLRAGSWVTCDLSWFPDYATQRRGMATMGQIVAIKDLDCAWREIVFEEVLPVEIPTPPAPVAGIALAFLQPPTTGSLVTLNIAGSATVPTWDWHVTATVVFTEQGEPPLVIMQDQDITAELDPAPGTVTTTATQHEWDADFERAGFEGDHLVDVFMVVWIMEGTTEIDRAEVSTSYTTDDLGS